MSGERRERGRQRVNQNVEEDFHPDANMWVQMMQHDQQMVQMMQQQIQQNASLSSSGLKLCIRVTTFISSIHHHQSLEIQPSGSLTGITLLS